MHDFHTRLNIDQENNRMVEKKVNFSRVELRTSCLLACIAAFQDGQDLIFLESPQDEIFDPLFSKDIPQRPVPSIRPSQPPPPVPGVARSTSSLPGEAIGLTRKVT